MQLPVIGALAEWYISDLQNEIFFAWLQIAK